MFTLKTTKSALFRILFTILCSSITIEAAVLNGQNWRIASGSLAQEAQFPEVVSLQRKGLTFQSHFCSGVLVAADALVTSAYCVANIVVADTVVVAGVTNFETQSNVSQQVGVSRVVLHPDYNMTLIRNDIAVVHLRLPFELNDNVKTMDLPSEFSEVEDFESCQVCGWGKTQAAGSISTQLYYANTTAISDNLCRNYHSPSTIVDSHVCTQVSSAEACEGDFGGPLICSGKRIWTGLITRGNFCGQYQLPGIYTQISHFTQFIIDEAYLDGRRKIA